MEPSMHVQQPQQYLGGTALPESHEEQVKLGFRMIDSAFSSKVQYLEGELRTLKMTCEETKSQAAGLQRKNSALEVELVESHQRSSKLAEENRELFKTVQSLRKQLQRLEGLKKKVLDSITDEAPPDDFAEARSYALQNEYYAGYGTAPSAGSGAMAAGRPVSPVPAPLSPRSMPGFAGAPAGVPNGRPISPSQAAGGAIDGKQFFKTARSLLPYEAFNDFLSSIKRLNTQQQTREQTLEEARRIFGPELTHLYRDFEQLLNRHALAP